MNEPKPRFTGIFIPAEILEIEELSFSEKFLLSWVDALYCKTHGGCFASNEYLAKKLGVKENTVVKSLTKLRKMKLIEDISFDGRIRVIKALLYEAVAKSQSYAGWEKNPSRVGQKSHAPSIYDSKEKEKESQVAAASMRCTSFLSKKIYEVNPKGKKPNLKLWANDIEKLMTIDGRAEEEINQVIEWVSKDDFWCKNILSGKKLRQKFDQLFISMIKHKASPNKKVEEEAKLQAVRLEKNKNFAKEFLRDKRFPGNETYMKLNDQGVQIKYNGRYQILGFLEHGFADQLKNWYMKLKQ